MNTTCTSEIIAAISGVPAAMRDQNLKGNASWTAAIKSRLITLGKEKGYQVCAAGFPNNCESEWLYDLVWYRSDASGHLCEIGLVLESEWSYAPKDVKFDFEKLLAAKSPVKAMIFQDYKGNLLDLLKLLETGIRSFPSGQNKEEYILACYENHNDAFAIKAVTL